VIVYNFVNGIRPNIVRVTGIVINVGNTTCDDVKGFPQDGGQLETSRMDCILASMDNPHISPVGVERSNHLVFIGSVL
jgi:hypothetical protein